MAQQVESDDHRFSGILFGLWAMLTKLALAMAVGIGFVSLGMAGFDPSAPTQTAIVTLSLLYGTLPVVLKLIVFLLMRTYDEKA